MNFAEFTRKCKIKIVPSFDKIGPTIHVDIYYGRQVYPTYWLFTGSGPITYDEAIRSAQVALYNQLRSLEPDKYDRLTFADRLSGLVKKETKNEN